MRIWTKSRDKALYEATGEILDKGRVVVFKGSKINTNPGEKFVLSEELMSKRNDTAIVSQNGELLIDVSFGSLSTAASFVTGRIANGMIVWKTEDGKYVRYSIKK